ncbi:hypothetical protein F4820DRAFT_197883 [Hypoxylon rubiginosum]|uniref:Uncharacterized protein n=1 Tax=Hypoxylon rubiginosum TaxID=110542 RepID=A0ACB9Z7T0_9PEZI|nr:hypothetical protein F4820DRAFT_197883 [Hypoxylon rubiginosum]
MNILHARLTVLSNDGLSTPPSANTLAIGLVPPSTEGWKVIISGIVLTLVTALWTWMRLWSLRQDGRAFALEDGLNLGAVIFFFSLISTDFVMVFVGGLGYHMNNLQDWHVTRLLKAIYARQFLYAATLGLVKISIVLMFMRIFFAPRFKLVGIAAIALTVACVLSTVLINLLICRPITRNWQTPLTARGACENEEAALMAIGIIDLANQLAILMLPVPKVIKLGMETRYKIVTAFLFSIGILSLAFGILRLFTVLRTDFTNASYSGVPPTIYGASEASIAIIVSSCPLLRPVFDRLLSISLAFGNLVWKDRGADIIDTARRRRMSTKSSGFTQMRNQSREGLELELGNMGAHRSKRATSVTVGRRPPSCDDDDSSSVRRIVVTSETIVIRDRGEL